MKYDGFQYNVYNSWNGATGVFSVKSFSDLYEREGGSFIYGWSVY